MSTGTAHSLGLTPRQLGASDCPNCSDGGDLHIELKTIASRTMFAELFCCKCNREAISEVHGGGSKCIQQVVERWNSRWPDITGYLDSPTEGVKIYA